MTGRTETKRKNEAKCSTLLQYNVPYQVILSAKDAIEIKKGSGTGDSNELETSQNICKRGD